MNAIDRAILEFCRNDFCPLKPLRDQIPSGTLYRHANRLVALGWLRKESGLYRTTESGVHQLAEAASRRRWDRFERLYAPLALVPTAVHRAMIKLISAAVVCRQHETRPDRHPFFVLFGGTLRWKTSTGAFVCHALGLDPAAHIVECGAEAGKSLWVRRSSSGTLVFKRELLDAPFLTVDEFLSADSSVRGAIGIFLTGRLVMPVENEHVTLRPVPLLTLNPRARHTLEERIGLSAPQIRRAILANLDAIPMPDLAQMGERAIAAAQAAGPLALSAARADCGGFHRAIVDLTRAVILPEAHDRVDVEVVVNLCTGMTAFIPEPAEAITEVVHALGILAETMGWARTGWVETVINFTLEDRSTQPDPARALAIPAQSARMPEAPGAGAIRAFPLQVPRPPGKSGVPDLTLSEELRARLIWFAVDSKLPLEAALDLLLRFYLGWRQQKTTLLTLYTILFLAEELNVAEVDVETLRGYLEAKAELEQYDCTFEDVPQALEVLDLLSELPEAWDWPMARAAIQAVATIIAAGIEASQIEMFLQRHHRLLELGFDEAVAEAVAKALTEAGATGDRRDEVLRVLAADATRTVDRVALEQACRQLRAEVAKLTAERDELRQRVKAAKTRLANLQAVERAALTRQARLQAECEAHAADLGALRGLRALLLGKAAEIGPFLADVERLQQWRRQGRAQDPQYAAVANDLRVKVAEFFQQLVAEVQTA